MNIIKRRSTVKNSRKEEYDIPQHLDLLNKWTIPKISPRIIYQIGTFEKLGLKQVVKTTEETITIDSDNQTFRLLSDNDLAPYKDIYRFMHIGLVQVAFKPLTLRGLPESFIAALRDECRQEQEKLIALEQSARQKLSELLALMESEKSQGSVFKALLLAKEASLFFVIEKSSQVLHLLPLELSLGGEASFIQGIYGRMGDLDAIDAKYDIAISTACLGLDYIVVETATEMSGEGGSGQIRTSILAVSVSPEAVSNAEKDLSTLVESLENTSEKSVSELQMELANCLKEV
ncbi:hypothetical protein H5410_006812 [Solanum commersonii]|uniref:Uncharacterized protein n=1 Tax=Solanum commersonii TaxID=4109 RepID=A0A9J6ABL5_SOLCO|nr:hypothetical protein H5410_006812 [Solanum commersonii]